MWDTAQRGGQGNQYRPSSARAAWEETRAARHSGRATAAQHQPTLPAGQLQPPSAPHCAHQQLVAQCAQHDVPVRRKGKQAQHPERLRSTCMPNQLCTATTQMHTPPAPRANRCMQAHTQTTSSSCAHGRCGTKKMSPSPSARPMGRPCRTMLPLPLFQRPATVLRHRCRMGEAGRSKRGRGDAGSGAAGGQQQRRVSLQHPDGARVGHARPCLA